MEQYLPLITGSGGALVILAAVAWAFYSGKIHSDREFSKLEEENAALKAESAQYRIALETERKTVGEVASAGQVTNQLINALTTLASERSSKPAPPGLTAKDIGL